MSELAERARCAGRAFTEAEAARFRELQRQYYGSGDAPSRRSASPGAGDPPLPHLQRKATPLTPVDVAGAQTAALKREKRRKLDGAKHLLERAEAAGRDLNGAEQAEWNVLLQDVATVDRELGKRMDARLEADRRAAVERGRAGVVPPPAPEAPVRSTVSVRRAPWY